MQPHNSRTLKGVKIQSFIFIADISVKTLLKQYAATSQVVILMRRSAPWRTFGNQHLSKQKWLQYKFQLIHD